MSYILCSMIKSSNKKTVKNIFYAVGATLTYDTYDSFKCDYEISDNDINNDFLTRLVNTILNMSDDEFFHLLKMLDDNNII